MTAPAEAGPVPGGRPGWRAVAVPGEHGGWGLTAEPVLLGLLVAPSWAGLLIGLAAVAAFLARTPARVVVVDRRRGRWLERSRLAARLAAVEAAVLAVLAAGATVLAGWRWWWAVLVAVPLVAVEWWFDVRSRSRRLVPELCGAVGVAAASSAIVLAAGGDASLAAGVWLVLAARVAGAVPFVRSQVRRLRRRDPKVWDSDLAQVVAVAVGAAAVLVDRRLTAGWLGVVVLASLQVGWARRRPPPVRVVGLRQMALGLALVVVTALGVWTS